MGDSDEEYSHNKSANGSFNNSMKKNRDKFYRERDDQSNTFNYQTNRRDWTDDRNRGEWKSASNRSSNFAPNSGAYPRKYQSGHDSSPPPHKRRKDFDSAHQPDYQRHLTESDHATQPPLLSFKQFLQQQDDNISDDEAIKKYNEYKIEFKKTQINNFFLEHKEEEWFKLRYHPDESYKRRDEQNNNVIHRLRVFMDLLEKGWVDSLSLEMVKAKEIVRFLDACVIRLEGGSDDDVHRLLDGGEHAEQSKTSESNGDTGPQDQQQTEHKSEADEAAAVPQPKAEDTGSESGAYTDSDSESEKKTRKKKSRSSKPSGKQSSQLHKTASIFMPKLSPSVCKEDLEMLCKQYEGFKRVALSDPAPERGFYRRGWITFESNVDVKKICWDLQNIKVKDSNPGAIVNREIASRIRPAGSLATYQKRVVKNDLKLAMKMIQNMDKKWAIWQKKEEAKSVKQQVDVKTECKEEEAEKDDAVRVQEEYVKLEESGFSALPAHQSAQLEHTFHGANPLLQNITDYLVDEANAEESELLGHDQAQSKNGTDFEIDEHFLKALDKLILYLRVVHSIDFYNSIEYQQEDWMPNRLGIMFVRPPLNSNYKPNSDEVEEYVKHFESKLKPYVEYREKVELELARRLGLKDRKQEIEKFVQTNTQELAPDRWLCPLSGKRFKGPEFIRKHLFYKHMEKIVDVKKEVDYFNNYLMDPKRPQLPEHPSNRPAAQSAASHSQSQHQSYQQYPANQPVNYTSPGIMNQMAAAAGYQQMRPGWSGPAYNMPDNMAQNYNQSGFNSQFGYQGYQAGFKKNPYQAPSQQNSFQRRGQREMIQYKDLDAPDDL